MSPAVAATLGTGTGRTGPWRYTLTVSLNSSHDAIRHCLVSLLYRFEHATGDAPDHFASFDSGSGVRTPQQIVLHLTGLIRFAHENLGGPEQPRPEPLDWAAERRRFFDSVQALDISLASGAVGSGDISLAQMWQGPIIDAVTHVGQLATLRRLAGSPVPRTRYWQVEMPPVDAY